MPWSIPIPATDPVDFDATATAARAQLDAQLADADDATKAVAEQQVDSATAAAALIISSGVLGEGLVSGMLAGHLPDPTSPYTTVAVQLSCAPVES